MSSGHKHSGSLSQNQKAQLANAYNELGRELSSTKLRVIGNYNLGKVIGEGAYGKVRMGTHRLTSTRVAIKQIPKAMSSSLTREIHHHRQLHHPHVTQMYEVIATESSIWIVTELCTGGELFDYLAEKGRLAEVETKILFGQLCLAVAYLHEKGIVHRDLKLENVLLDERCRVKLGDFGFTREFERGAFMETFCGTTGYASPEMLQGKRYHGPEVDVWSLGIILYCLLTGTLPFDDDDEALMREKIIHEEFEDPSWLSAESRDLLQNVIQKDPTKRLTIAQILAHPWFTTRAPVYDDHRNSSLKSLPIPSRQPSPSTIPSSPPDNIFDTSRSVEASTSSETSDATVSSFRSASSAFCTSTPTTPDDAPMDPFEFTKREDQPAIRRNLSESTITKTAARSAALEALQSPTGRTASKPETVEEEDRLGELGSPRTSSYSTLPPMPARTPARTKRRSVSSNLSDPESPTMEKLQPQFSLPAQDFSSLLSTPSPIIFSTPLERQLLNTLSTLGFDTGQMVHSVLSEACDAAGAMWWMLRRKAEKQALEEEPILKPLPELPLLHKTSKKSPRTRVSQSVQTDPEATYHSLSLAHSAPQLVFVPPTPTISTANLRTKTSPEPPSPTHPMLSPSQSVDWANRSQPVTPGGSLKEKDGSKGRKNRSGSVSMLQRASIALEATGLIRKKSSEAFRDEKQSEKSLEKERSREFERKNSASTHEDARSSQGSSKLLKTPPMRPVKDATPSTPPMDEEFHHSQPVGSPWVLTGSKTSPPRMAAPTPMNSPGGELLVAHASSASDHLAKSTVPPRNRANILTAFRLWFNDDRKGKRKEVATSPPLVQRSSSYRSTGNAGTNSKGSMKRRMSGNNASYARPTHRSQRPSASSRRSSSVNSRRSSGGASMHMGLESPQTLEQIPTRRSYGSHTPNSERGEYPSRPSSIRSFSMQRHRKSPSASSVGSASAQYRAASPKVHRRGGSGSSTRVVRQIQLHHARPTHGRSHSATSSIHSLTSSRPTSFYEASETEGPRSTSPFRYSRRSLDETTPRRATFSLGSTTFVAQKRHPHFTSPQHGSMGRSSWKKSWGMEPPGWQSRTAHLPIEVLAILPSSDGPATIRDVFSGKQSMSMGDESDWVDEEDDSPSFAGGLGQMPSSGSSSSFSKHINSESPLALSPPPRGHPNRATRRVTKPVEVAPVDPVSEMPSALASVPEGRAGRRQLPPSRAGPAAIQEEDEGEEE